MYDLLKSNKELWDLYLKKEEYYPTSVDQYNRFPFNKSKYKNILEPKISQFLIENYSINYPHNKKFAVLLTHDIDFIYTPEYPNISKMTTKKRIHNAVKSIKRKEFDKSLWFLGLKGDLYANPKNLGRIIDIEKEYNAKSTFFIMALEKGDEDYNYSLDDIEYEIGIISDAGWEIGLHGGHKAYNNGMQMQIEKKRLENFIGKKIKGYRNHYLRFQIPITWELLKQNGFLYDTTYGYAEHIGFRNGMCHPFHPYNLDTNEAINILEIPCAIMDRTLCTYMGLNSIESWEMIKKTIDVVEENNGVLTILWHNTSMYGDQLDLYERILQYCDEKGAWMTSGEEIAEWWEKNKFFN
ncbi:MAG: polysaccharide deacetylase family protein [Thermoplasmata archaeon]|nr:polysaccharide deacetylase family protein [Thermoplasmata archaeon]